MTIAVDNNIIIHICQFIHIWSLPVQLVWPGSLFFLFRQSVGFFSVVLEITCQKSIFYCDIVTFFILSLPLTHLSWQILLRYSHCSTLQNGYFFYPLIRIFFPFFFHCHWHRIRLLSHAHAYLFNSSAGFIINWFMHYTCLYIHRACVNGCDWSIDLLFISFFFVIVFIIYSCNRNWFKTTKGPNRAYKYKCSIDLIVFVSRIICLWDRNGHFLIFNFEWSWEMLGICRLKCRGRNGNFSKQPGSRNDILR